MLSPHRSHHTFCAVSRVSKSVLKSCAVTRRECYFTLKHGWCITVSGRPCTAAVFPSGKPDVYLWVAGPDLAFIEDLKQGKTSCSLEEQQQAAGHAGCCDVCPGG